MLTHAHFARTHTYSHISSDRTHTQAKSTPRAHKEMAVLMQIGNKTLAFAVLGCELGVYILYKLVRKDFRYW